MMLESRNIVDYGNAEGYDVTPSQPDLTTGHVLPGACVHPRNPIFPLSSLIFFFSLLFFFPSPLS